jgi:PAS domain S-box-containing protein
MLKAMKHKHQDPDSSILERINDGFFVLDSNFNVTYWNKQAEIILCRKREEVLYKNLWESYPEAVNTEFYTQYYKSFRQQLPLQFESFFDPLNTWFEVNVYPSTDSLHVFFRNINERKKAEEEMRKLSLIAERTDNLVVITNDTGAITWVNEAFLKTTEYSIDEVCGQYPGNLLMGPETDIDTSLYIDSCIKLGEGFHAEILYYTKSGKKYWVDTHCQVVKDVTGRVQQFFAIQSDITDRKTLQLQLHEELHKRRQMITFAVIKAQDKEREMVSRELHDNINQVLTSAKLYIELGLSSNDRKEEILSKSMRLIQRSIDEIRNISKRLSDPSLLHCQLKDSATELIDTVRTTGKISVSLDVSGIENLIVDREVHLAAYRILQEQLTNILKHSGAHSVKVVFDYIDGDLVLKVTDDGIGFDAKKKRSGIGLTNMVTRAESLNGLLTINSAPGLGCVIIARLPLP